MKTQILALAVGAALVLGGTAAQADVIALHNTGVLANGAAQANNNAELFYSLVSAPVGATLALRTANSANGFPIGPWIGTNTTSSWIGPNSNSVLDGPTGAYDYRTTFDLTGLLASSALISGRWATDDQDYSDILINGVSTNQTSSGFKNWSNFNIGTGFVAGVNTLDFIVINGGGPTGLRVEMTGSANASTGAVPEPSTWALLIGGFGLTGVALRRRRTAVAATA